MRAERKEGYAEKIKVLSKRIQKGVRRATRAHKRERIGKILKEFKGLRHIASIR